MPEKFDIARERLESQYQNIPYDPESGLSGDELKAELEQHRRDFPDEPRILTRAWLFHLLCTKARIAVDPDDYFVDKLEHHNLLIQLRNEWLKIETEKEFQNDPPLIPGTLQTILDTSHTCPDWQNLLEYGFTGLRNRAAAKSGAFYQAVTMVYDAVIKLIERFDKALSNPTLANLAERPPQTFHEALQLALLYNELQTMEGEEIRSMGRFDLLYNPFYINDLKTGILTREHAKELLKYFWIKFYAKSQGKLYGKPFLFGPDVNELSFLSFEVFHEMQTVDPKFHVRLSEKTPQVFLERIADCIQDGCTGIVIVNDSKQVKMLCQNGKKIEDARNYILIGCYEPAVMGKELNWSGASHLNLAKAIELTLSARQYDSFDDFFKGYIDTIDTQLEIIFDRVKRNERLWPSVNPSPLLSGTMDSCLESGKDVSMGGAEYNTSGCVCAGIANAVDSLAVIRQLVFEEKRCTQTELSTILAANWQGHEELHLTARNRVPKWGNNDDRVDKLAVKITRHLGERINHEPNARNDVFQAALYCIINASKNLGKHTGALPDGRLAGEPLTMNSGATPGMDKNGVTSLINSVTKIDLSLFPSGTVLDIMLHPSAAKGHEGINTICSIVRSHFAQGGMAIQFNIFDADILREARKNPEKYANLQVRVCGWNVRFADLAPEEQDIFITKAEAV